MSASPALVSFSSFPLCDFVLGMLFAETQSPSPVVAMFGGRTLFRWVSVGVSLIPRPARSSGTVSPGLAVMPSWGWHTPCQPRM